MRSLFFVVISLAIGSAWAFNFSAIVPTPAASQKAQPVHREVASAHPAQAFTIEHTVMKDETAWFLSTVFYGKGNQFAKILESNGLKTPEQIKAGMVLKIESPEYTKTQANFAQRYTDLWEKRAIALEKKTAGSETVDRDRVPSSTEVSRNSVIPVEKIRGKDTINGVPFSQMINSSSSPADLARDELQNRKARRATPESGH